MTAPKKTKKTAKGKEVWERENPKKTSSKLTKKQRSAAKKQAKKHGRSKPSLVDNINAKKNRTGGPKKTGRAKGKRQAKARRKADRKSKR